MLSPISGMMYTNNRVFFLTEYLEASLLEGMKNIDYYIHKTKTKTASQTKDAETLLKDQHSSATNKEARTIIHKHVNYEIFIPFLAFTNAKYYKGSIEIVNVRRPNV
jgi:hypothetical protein